MVVMGGGFFFLRYYIFFFSTVRWVASWPRKEYIGAGNIAISIIIHVVTWSINIHFHNGNISRKGKNEKETRAVGLEMMDNSHSKHFFFFVVWLIFISFGALFFM